MPSFIKFSVRGALFMLLFFPFVSFRYAAAPLEGKWQCDTKSGKLDATTNYVVNCDGYLLFKPDQTLESTCLDGFFPTGALWETSGTRLILKDSDGQAFADFDIRNLNDKQLTLFRKGVTYLFRKTN